MTAKRRVTAKTIRVWNALSVFATGGATVDMVADACDQSTRSVAQRLIFLRRQGAVRYVRRGARWHLTADTLFQDTQA